MTDERQRPRRGAGGEVEFIKPTPLADKVPPMGGPNPRDALRRAEDVVSEIAGEFEGILAEELTELDELMAAYKENPDDETLDRVFRKVHNLRGQGTTLGFPLITRIGTSFCRYIIERNSARPINQPLIEKHLQALHIVLKEKRAQQGDEMSQQVADALEKAVQKEMA